MAKHTFICSSGRRLLVNPCKVNPALVRVSILSSDRQEIAAVTIDPHTAAVISQALDIEARASLQEIQRDVVKVLPINKSSLECLEVLFAQNEKQTEARAVRAISPVCPECREIVCDDDCAYHRIIESLSRLNAGPVVQAYADNNGFAPKAGA